VPARGNNGWCVTTNPAPRSIASAATGGTRIDPIDRINREQNLRYG